MTFFYCKMSEKITDNEIGLMSCLSSAVREMYGVAGLGTLQLECLLAKGNYFIVKADTMNAHKLAAVIPTISIFDESPCVVEVVQQADHLVSIERIEC